MNILILGSGGREHALAWKIAASPLVHRVYCAPGNAGIAEECELVALDPADHDRIMAFGPSKAAARLEGSKGFTKDLCKAHNIPTAAYARFADCTAAKHYVRRHGAPIVVKADGLAAGKGVTVAETVEEAEAAIKGIFAGANGATEVVIEARLVGEEASFFALCDGEHAIPL